MLLNITKYLYWLQNNPQVFQIISRGLEREFLRITPEAKLSQKPHPKLLGSALTNKWFTTDFSESSLELITPVFQDLDKALKFLTDLHCYAARNIGKESIWPFSLPCKTNCSQNFPIAYYGKFYSGKRKVLYRKGLENRYGVLSQMLSGIHYNFSFSNEFWHALAKLQNKVYNTDFVSSNYLKLIRNFYRYGFILPYLFGTSPACYLSFAEKYKIRNFSFFQDDVVLFLKGTSARMAYMSKHQLRYAKNINFHNMFNSIEGYKAELKKALTSNYVNYNFLKPNTVQAQKLQINTNYFQQANELYLFVKPKEIRKKISSFNSSEIENKIDYLEIRSIDINPFVPTGILQKDLEFLDLFMIWCVLLDTSEFNNKDIEHVLNNWETVSLAGRNLNQKFSFLNACKKTSLFEIGKKIIIELFSLAQIIDKNYLNKPYQNACLEFEKKLYKPELTYSAALINFLHQKKSYYNAATYLAKKNTKTLKKINPSLLSQQDFYNEVEGSLMTQKILENQKLKVH